MSELRMPAINQVTLTGRLAQDPEFRLTESGHARLSGRLAVNRSYRDRDGQWQSEASFFSIVVWQKLAEFCADRLRKGTPVLVTGRLHSHSWRDEAEQPRSLVEVQVRSLQVLERPAAGQVEEVAEGDDETEAEELEVAA
ncbi:MAG: single-stranded DNA-binding protein [Gemmatimonadota bacterium]